MIKTNSELKSAGLDIFFSAFAMLLLTLSLINLKLYFNSQNANLVLAAKKEEFDEKQYWSNFLEANPAYFPGYIELAKMQISDNELNKAVQTILTAKEINPNSPLVIELEQSLK